MPIVYILFYGIILGLIIYSLKSPKRLFDKSLERRFLLIIAAAYTLLALASLINTESDKLTSLFFVSFPIFYSIVIPDKVLQLIGKVNWLKVLVTILVLYLIEEFLFDLSTPQNIISAEVNLIVFYLVFAVITTFLILKTKLNTLTLFIIGGIIGIIFEQKFRIFSLISAGNLISLIFYIVYVFPVYGFYLAGPKILFRNENKSKNN